MHGKGNMEFLFLVMGVSGVTGLILGVFLTVSGLGIVSAVILALTAALFWGDGRRTLLHDIVRFGALSFLICGWTAAFIQDPHLAPFIGSLVYSLLHPAWHFLEPLRKFCANAGPLVYSRR